MDLLCLLKVLIIKQQIEQNRLRRMHRQFDVHQLFGDRGKGNDSDQRVPPGGYLWHIVLKYAWLPCFKKEGCAAWKCVVNISPLQQAA